MGLVIADLDELTFLELLGVSAIMVDVGFKNGIISFGHNHHFGCQSNESIIFQNFPCQLGRVYFITFAATFPFPYLLG